MNQNTKTVTVLGLGNMGAAIADAMISKEYKLTV